MAQRKKISSDTIIAIMATIVSCCALAVSGYQAYLQRQQQDASVWPYLQIDMFARDDIRKKAHSFKVTINNKGIGPAIIENIDLTYLKKHYNNISDLIEDNTVINGEYSYNSLREDQIIGQNESLDLFYVLASEKQVDSVKKFIADSELMYKIKYRSVYGKKWELHWNADIQKVKTIQIEE